MARQSRSARATTVWEFDLIGTDGAIAIVSADASERGWYHSESGAARFRKARPRSSTQSRWQLSVASRVALGQARAFLDGWSSDRGLVAGEIQRSSISKTGKLTTLAAAEAANVTTMAWRDEKSLWFAGWSKLGSDLWRHRHRRQGRLVRYEDAIIGTNSFAASLTPAPDKQGFAAVRETAGAPPEIVFKSSAASAMEAGHAR